MAHRTDVLINHLTGSLCAVATSVLCCSVSIYATTDIYVVTYSVLEASTEQDTLMGMQQLNKLFCEMDAQFRNLWNFQVLL